MKPMPLSRISLGQFSILLYLCLGFSGIASAELQWPRVIDIPQGRIIIYQPQLETFKENSLTSRSAVSVTPAGFEEPVFGTVWVAARVATDRAAGVVTCEKAFVKQVRLPGASDEQVKKLTEILKTEVPRKGLSISLDRVLAMLDLAKTEEAVKSEIAASPPRIIPVTHPAVLVCLDGEPAFSRIENSKLLRVVNTPYTIVMDPGTAKFYLRAPWGWLRASDYGGPWEKVESIPDSVAAIAPSPAGGEAKSGADPEIIVATEPTELVVIEGEPELGFVEGTDLYYLLNSKSDVFVDSSNHLYILLSGRWFTASDKRGPWSHVPSDQLPESFKAIPKTFERPHVLACISGREEAHFARLDTFVPETAAIKRKAASVTPLYVGEPEFTPIEGTALSYAANSPHDILKIDERYYCCYDGVWFESDAPKGPMAVSGSVPPAVYSLPPNCPLYHVKFVHVYDATDEIAYVGYTPGYIGCYTLGNTIVHGTGYEPQPVGSSSAIPRPHTYGFSCAYDPSAGKWGFRAPSYGGVEWFASSAGEKREVLPLSGLSFTWWGPAGYSLFGAAGSQSGQAPQLTEGSSDSSDPIYQRHPDWLARESWGRKLARRQESLPPTPTPLPAPPEGTDQEAQGQTRSEAEWEALRRQSEMEQETREAEEAQRAEKEAAMKQDLYSDAEGNVYRRSLDGWQSVGGADTAQPARSQNNPDLDRQFEARKRGERRERDPRWSRSGAFGQDMGTVIYQQNRDLLQVDPFSF